MSQTICLVLLMLAAVLYCTNIIPTALTSLLVLVTLIFTNILTPAEAFSGFSNTTVILFASIFVVAGALEKTDFVSVCGKLIYKCKDNERKLIIVIMVITGTLSAVLSTTGLAALLIPVIIGISKSTGFKRSKLLLPMAIAGSLGGGILVLGGGGNSVIYAALEALNNGTSFSILDMPKVGIPATLIAIIYTGIIGYRLLPEREVIDNLEGGDFKTSGLSKWRQCIIYVIVVLTVLAMIFESQIGVKLYLSALIGAILIILTGCLTEAEAIKSIKWPTLIMFAGILPLSTALTKTGTAKSIANYLINIAGGSKNPNIIIFMIITTAFLFTQFMSNSASLALFCPLAASIGVELGADPRGLIMAAAVGASISLCTPVASPPEAMIYTVGGYKPTDYLKYSLPICILIIAFMTFYIPMLWPLF